MPIENVYPGGPQPPPVDLAGVPRSVVAPIERPVSISNYQPHSFAGTDYQITAILPYDTDVTLGQTEEQRRLADVLAVLDRNNDPAQSALRNSLLQRYKAAGKAAEGPSYRTLGSLQTLSVTTRRSVSPVRRLGEPTPAFYTRGPRTIAGSLSFILMNEDVLLDLYRRVSFDASDSEQTFFADRMPPFNVIITGANEYGNIIEGAIFGITLMASGMTLSVEDFYTEQTYCVDADTEALTEKGWKKYSAITAGDRLLTLNAKTRKIEWQPALSIHKFKNVRWLTNWKTTHGFDVLSTANHRWLTTNAPELYIKGFESADFQIQETRHISKTGRLVVTAGGSPDCFAKSPTWSDQIVELAGWAVTEGTICWTSSGNPYGVTVAQSITANPENVDKIRKLVEFFRSSGATATEINHSSRAVDNGGRDFYFGKGVAKTLLSAIPDRSLNPKFLLSLTYDQAVLLKTTMMSADGHVSASGSQLFVQNQGDNAEMFQMLCAMLGERTWKRRIKDLPITRTTVYRSKIVNSQHLSGLQVPYSGVVWCPKTENGTWLARRNGGTFWTGNTYVARWMLPMATRDRSHAILQRLGSSYRGRGIAPISQLNPVVLGTPFSPYAGGAGLNYGKVEQS